MDEATAESGEDVEVLFGMNIKPGQQRGAEDVQPMELACHAQAGLVGIDHGGQHEQAFDGASKWVQLGRDVFACGQDGCLTDGLPEEVPTHLAQAVEGQELIDVAVDEPGEEANAVLDWSFNAGGKGGADIFAGARAALDLGAVLGYFQRPSREFKDLSRLVAQHGLFAQ